MLLAVIITTAFSSTTQIKKIIAVIKASIATIEL
jgi:hypothetical protein